MFSSVIPSSGITFIAALYCTLASLGLGLLIAAVYTIKSNYTKNFVITLALLPVIVQVVIMMVNGNIGTGVAVLGAFSLIRFRSVPGSSKEILSIFMAMAIGIATGMGYLLFAILISVVICIVFIILKFVPFGEGKKSKERHLKITIPENIDYTCAFEQIFKTYLTSFNIEKVKTTNLGSLFEITYHVTLKDNLNEKKFIDDIRVINSNLPVISGAYHPNTEEL